MCVLTNRGIFGYVESALLLALVLCSSTARSQDTAETNESRPAAARESTPPLGVCPPFHLRDEQGNVINPVAGENADKPYSPKQTCGECRDYDKVTHGFHFMQGKGEEPTAEQKARCLWALHFRRTWTVAV